MDPDMVRQQEEEEMASRPRGAMKVKMPAGRHTVSEKPIVLRAEPHPPKAPSRSFPKPSGITPWSVVQTSVTGSVFAAIGLFGGIMLGVKIGLIPEQRMAIGAGAGFFLGWQSMVLSLHRMSEIALGRSMMVSIVPTALIVGGSIAGMAAAAHLTGMSQLTAVGDLSMRYWLIAGGAMLAGTFLAGVRLYRTLSR
jgi:hypothetical protein